MSLRGGATRIEYRVEGPLWIAEWDAGQVSQVLSNLVLNAREATDDRGHVVITARNLTVDSTAPASLLPGHYIEIRVEDDGPGITAKDAEMIFDPYFSTKSDHRGLGLSSAYSVAKRHGGILKLDLARSPGASLVLYLPANPDASLETLEVESQDYCTGGHVLVMDDEPRLRELLTDCLLAIACRVEGAADGDEAVRKYAAATNRGDPFDVVILDLTIRGGMGGAETLKKLQKIHPKVLAIACSGYTNDPVMCDHEKFGFAMAIEKPFRFAVLARAVRTLVGRSQRVSFRPTVDRRA
jgi:CheY-like chemotaxis protein